MRIQLSFFIPLALMCQASLACYEGPPELAPTLVSPPPVVTVTETSTASSEGSAKALFNLDAAGLVTKVIVVETNPDSLDKRSIELQLKKARFRVDDWVRVNGGVEDYIYSVDVELVRVGNEL